MIFEIGVILISLVLLLFMYQLDKKIFKIYGLIFIGVLLFEYFTQALWLNKNLESWAYIYLDVSWVITLGWSTIIVTSKKLIETYFPSWKSHTKFIGSLISITIIGYFAEATVVGLGIREYSTAVLNVASGVNLGLVPIETLYYIPVFVTLVMAFASYWQSLLFKNNKLKIGGNISK
jgi:hypothetical protein